MHKIDDGHVETDCAHWLNSPWFREWYENREAIWAAEAAQRDALREVPPAPQAA